MWKTYDAYRFLLLLHQLSDLIIKTLFFHYLISLSIFFFIVQLTCLDHLSSKLLFVHVHFLNNCELLKILKQITLIVILIFFFILQFLLCNCLFILQSFQCKLFCCQLTLRKADSHLLLMMTLVMLLYENGFDAFSAHVFVYVFHLNIVYLRETVIS